MKKNDEHVLKWLGLSGSVALSLLCPGGEQAAPIMNVLRNMAVNVASDYFQDISYPYLREKWIRSANGMMNHYIKLALEKGIIDSLKFMQKDYIEKFGDKYGGVKRLFQKWIKNIENHWTTKNDEISDEMALKLLNNYESFNIESLISSLDIPISKIQSEDLKNYLKGNLIRSIAIFFEEAVSNDQKAQFKIQLFYNELFEEKLDSIIAKTGSESKLLTKIRKSIQELHSGDFIDPFKKALENVLANQLERLESKIDKIHVLLIDKDYQSIQQKVNELQGKYDKKLKLLDFYENEDTFHHDLFLILSEDLLILDTEKNEWKDKMRILEKMHKDTLNFIENVEKEKRTKRFIEASELFKLGNGHEALQILNAKDLNSDLNEQLSKKEKSDLALDQISNDYILKANINQNSFLKNQNWESETIGCYERAIKAKPSALNYFKFAYFLSNQKDYQKAIQLYIISKAKYSELIISNPSANEPYVAVILNNLGILQKDQGNVKGAEKSYNAALEIYKRLAITNPSAYESYVGDIFNNLGILQMDQGDSKEAEGSCKAALEIRKRLAITNPSAYEPTVAVSLNNLGLLQSNQGDAKGAEESYKAALDIFKRLAITNPSAYEPYIASALGNLGILQNNQMDAKRAEESHKAALEIFKRLAITNPSAYEPSVAQSLNNFGVLQSDHGDTKGAEESYKAALEIRKRLAKTNPSAYKPDVASSLNNLGNLQKDQGDFEGAEERHKAALEIRKKLVITNPSAYEPDVASSLHNLGILQKDQGDFEGAEESYKAALEIRKRLAITNPSAYESDVANSLNSLGNLQKDQGDFEGAEESYKAALEILKRLAITNSFAYKPDVAMILNNFGELQMKQGDFKGAEENYKAALEINKRLAITNPSVYEPDVAMVLNNFGELQFEQGDAKGAEEKFKAALEILKKYKSKELFSIHYQLAISFMGLAIIFQKIKPDKKVSQSNAKYTVKLLTPYGNWNKKAIDSIRKANEVLKYWESK